MKKTKHLIITLMIACAFCFLPAIKTSAATAVQTTQTQDSITVQWTAPSLNSKYYSVQNYIISVKEYSTDVAMPAITVPATQTSYTVTGLKPGTQYTIDIDYNQFDSSNNRVSTGSINYFNGKTLPGKVANVHQDRWYYWIESVNVDWDDQNGVDSYEYKMLDNKKKTIKSGTTSGTSMSSSIKNSMVYTGEWSDVTYLFTQPRIKSAKLAKKKLTVKWTKVNGATSYSVYISTKKTSGYKKVKTVSSKKSSATITKYGKKKLTKKKYYVYIQTNKKVNGKTSTSGRLYYWNTKNTGTGYF